MPKQFYFKQFCLSYKNSSISNIEMTGPYQVPPLRDRVNLGAMAMKNYSEFLKATVLLEPHH